MSQLFGTVNTQTVIGFEQRFFLQARLFDLVLAYAFKSSRATVYKHTYLAQFWSVPFSPVM